MEVTISIKSSNAQFRFQRTSQSAFHERIGSENGVDNGTRNDFVAKDNDKQKPDDDDNDEVSPDDEDES